MRYDVAFSVYSYIIVFISIIDSNIYIDIYIVIEKNFDPRQCVVTIISALLWIVFVW